MKLQQGTLIKLSDDRFEGKHPNGIDVGYVAKGSIWQYPEVGDVCIVNNLKTSMVTEVLEDGVFKTLNSTYKLKIDE